MRFAIVCEVFGTWWDTGMLVEFAPHGAMVDGPPLVMAEVPPLEMADVPPLVQTVVLFLELVTGAGN